MILTDKEILKQIGEGNILIDPFDMGCLGSNSYDVHLGGHMGIYEDDVLDCKKDNPLKIFELSEEGVIIVPGKLYLGVTKEYTETLKHVPFLEGKSSIGRLGIDIHSTAGKGDIGYKNRWTLEISVKQPVKIYPEMLIGQLIYFKVCGEVETDYESKPTAKYNEVSKYPIGSKMHLNFLRNV